MRLSGIPLGDSIPNEPPRVSLAILPFVDELVQIQGRCLLVMGQLFQPAAGPLFESVPILLEIAALGRAGGDVRQGVEDGVGIVTEWLAKNQRGAWATEIGLMIDLHHKFRRVENAEYPLVEVFRKGDWVDASMGMRKFGLAHADVKAVQHAFPNLGFHQNLMRLAWKEFKRHPLNPLPMMRW